jgi:hypothetical protein
MQLTVEAIVKMIEGWRDGVEIKVEYANDGDGRYDFMGFTVTKEGKADIKALIEQSA